MSNNPLRFSVMKKNDNSGYSYNIFDFVGENFYHIKIESKKRLTDKELFRIFKEKVQELEA